MCPNCPTLSEVTPPLPDRSEHPSGFEFDYDFWFGCECGQRNRISSAQYTSLIESGGDLECTCGNPIDVGDPGPILRDLEDVDYASDEIDQHYWYHSTTYEDWPSPASHDREVRELYGSVEDWDTEFREEVIRNKTSVALHFGTYAAAIENMMRRMTDQPTPGRDYWLHQVKLRFTPGDLSGQVGDESWSNWGDVPTSQLERLGVLAARYVNCHEAPGSISLAIHPGAITHIISEVRSIRLPVEEAAAPVVPDGEYATAQALAYLKEAEALRPDVAGIPPDQIFDIPIKFQLARKKGEISREAIAVNEQLLRYRDRRGEIWAALRRELVAVYLDQVNPWVHERFVKALATMASTDTDPQSYHYQFRVLAGLLVQPHLVAQRFEEAPSRTLDPSS